MFAVSSEEEEEEEEEKVPALQLQPGEKGLPLGHRGKNYHVQEGQKHNTKVYVCVPGATPMKIRTPRINIPTKPSFQYSLLTLLGTIYFCLMFS